MLPLFCRRIGALVPVRYTEALVPEVFSLKYEVHIKTLAQPKVLIDKVGTTSTWQMDQPLRLYMPNLGAVCMTEVIAGVFGILVVLFFHYKLCIYIQTWQKCLF